MRWQHSNASVRKTTEELSVKEETRQFLKDFFSFAHDNILVRCGEEKEASAANERKRHSPIYKAYTQNSS